MLITEESETQISNVTTALPCVLQRYTKLKMTVCLRHRFHYGGVGVGIGTLPSCTSRDVMLAWQQERHLPQH